MSSTVENLDHFIACSDCDLLLPYDEIPPNHSIVCPRCGKKVLRKTSNSVRKTLAISLTGILLYLPAMYLPLMTFESFGFSDSANILESVINFYHNEYYFVSFMVLLSAVIFPLLLLSSIFTVTFLIRCKRYPRYLVKLLRTYLHLEEWAMVEVYLLGILITVIKMGDTTDIDYQAGIFCFVGLVLSSLATSTIIDRNHFWKMIEHKGARPKIRQADPKYSKTWTTAAEQGFILCHICHKLSSIHLAGEPCPRCGEILHSRKADSIARTWALIFTSVIFLFPANILPIMQVNFLGIPDRSTIMDGIIYFFQHNSYFIGLIIFLASILVPLFKVVGLIILLISTRPCSPLILKQKTRMFRVIAFIGRWSMLDVFVIALLTVLVNFGFFTSVHTAPAATYFCIVVASTMFAAITFDPRIMWDRCSSENNQTPLKTLSTLRDKQ